MSDIFSKSKRSEVMSLVRSRGNKRTEMRMMSLFRLKGIKGWRRHYPIKWQAGRLSVRPDFVFRHARVAVFVDGCFWHCCPRHSTQPKQNREFWEAKFVYNKAHDREVTQGLKRKGWKVVRIWQCALTVKRATRAVARIESVLKEADEAG